MSDQIPLSVIIITHRSDQRFNQAVSSVNFADEIIIKHETVITDFSKLKNSYLKLAKHEWVLFLDSDEVVSPALAAEIKQAITSNHINGFYIRRVDYFFGQPLHYGEVGNVWILRLAKKESVKFVRPVHEFAQVDGLAQRLTKPIYHHAHLSISEFYQKIIYYAGLEAESRFQKGIKFSWLEMVIYPLAKFTWNYFIKWGCLDGIRGFIYAFMMSLHSFIVRVRLYELTHPLNEQN